MKTILTTFIAASCLILGASAQTVSVFPTPANITTLGGKSFIADGAITTKVNKKLHPEGYNLTVSGGKVVIEYATERGKFYAHQTLRQLRSGDSVVNVKIVDFPAITYRGAVEGFYGRPWSHADRLAQLEFYGQNKLNTYIFGPKDDPYHSSPNWREPYPDEQAVQIAELAKAAAQNQVNFVWAIHPGKDIKWNDEDFGKLLSKFKAMYALGVKSFAIFFDDIAGDGVNATKQGQLMNRLNREFVKTHKGVQPLIICPTEYNKSWANPSLDTGYLVTLGKTCDKNVQIMWTGDKVCDDITDSTLNWINARINRPCYIWWNFPVTDYARHILLQGPSYGLTPNGAGKMSGFVSNPMENAESSKIALFGVADYAWNPKAYNAITAWQAAIKFIVPTAPEAYRTFAIHSADLEKNNNDFRRDESWELNPKDDGAVYAEFIKLAQVKSDLEGSGMNAALLAELRPWLVQAQKLGQRGARAVELGQFAKNGSKDVVWLMYRNGIMDSTQIKAYNEHKLGTLKLTPYIDSVRREVAASLMANRIESTCNCKISDGDLTTSIIIKGVKREKVPASATQIKVFLGGGSPVELYKTDKNGYCEKISVSNNYLCANIDPATAAFELRGTDAQIYEIVWTKNNKN